MADWFDFKGVRSTTLGVRVMEFPPLTLPEERVDFQQALGRSGSLTILEGEDVYNDVLLSVSCFIEDLTHLTLIATWLRGEGTLVLGNMSDKYYKARIVNQIDLRKILREYDHRLFSVIFRCQPYRYKYPATMPFSLVKGGTITNPGNIFSQPKYTIAGSGNIALTIGDKTINITGLSGSITIDTELGVAYQTASDPLVPLTSLVGRDDWPFTIEPGGNLVNWTGTITSSSVDPRWRYI